MTQTDGTHELLLFTCAGSTTETAAVFTGKMTAELPQRGARGVCWPRVRYDSHLQLELTSCVCLELVNDPEQSRITRSVQASWKQPQNVKKRMSHFTLACI